MSFAWGDLEYSPVPDRAREALGAEEAKLADLEQRIKTLLWVKPRPPDEDGETEVLHGVEMVHRFVEAPADSETRRWHFVESGEGEPVVLLHGLPESWFQWHRQMAELASSHRVISVDLKGYGQSDKRTGDYRHEGVSEQLLALLDVIGLDRFNLVTHDRGSVQGDYLAANHPERVLRYARGEQHLVHFNPDLAPQQTTYSHPDTSVILKDPPRQVLRSFLRLTAKAVEEEHIVRTIQELSWPDIWWAVPRYFNSSSFRQEWIDRRTRLLAAWRCPVLVMQGSLDPRQPREFYEDLQPYIPDAPVRTEFLDAGHFFHAEAPEQTTAAIRNFLGEPTS